VIQNIEIRTARSVPEVEEMREAWSKWPSHRDSDIDFFLMICRSYPEVLRPHVIGLYRDGKPESILVGRLERKRLNFRIGYKTVFQPWARCLTFVYGAVHGNGSTDNIRILVDEVMKSLRRGEADTALLEFVGLDSPLYDFALRVPGFLCRDTLPPAQSHHLMKIPSAIDEVYARMSSKHRKNLRREIKRLFNETGGVRIACYRSESELDQLFCDAELIAAKTYQRGLMAGFADNPQVRERLGLAARKGWLRANLLYMEKRPVAFWIGMLYGETFVSEYLGYDPEFRQWSPGMVLIMRIIQGFCAGADGDTVTELDFGLGHAEYKASLCTASWMEAPVYIFSPTVKGMRLKGMRTVTRLTDGVIRELIGSSTLFSKFKKSWRNHLASKVQPEPRTTVTPDSTGTQASRSQAVS